MKIEKTGSVGKIRNAKNISRIRDFSTLYYKHGITPTDIDAFVDFGGKLFVCIEGKHEKSSGMSRGQERALTSIADAIENPDKNQHAIIIIAEHGDEEPIVYGSLGVINFYENKKWTEVNKKNNVKEVVDAFLIKFNQEWRI